jgi:poly-gamma-glutamate synthesis protein (capsule biosynthesis protein)
VFCADPGTVAVLEDAGVDVVALANNHGMDAGSRGCDDTMETLAEHNIAFAGGRPEGSAADDVTYLEVNDTVFAFLAYTDLDFEHGAMCKVDADMENALTRVREARRHAEVVCVSYHWGIEYQKEPTERQVELGQATIDAGADVVLGHHPHVMGGVEWYHDGLILYSMGNFVFDQRDADDGRMNSAIFNLHFTVGSKLGLVIAPLRIPTPAYAPEAASAERAQTILAELVQLSADRGTNLRIEGQKAKGSFIIATPKRPAAPAGSEAQPAASTAERDHA